MDFHSGKMTRNATVSQLTVVLEQLVYVLHFSMFAVTVSPPPIPRNGEQIHTVILVVVTKRHIHRHIDH